MFAPVFDYHKANSVAEAIQLLGANNEAKLIAGGHSLIPLLKLRLARPTALIDIAGIADLKRITVNNGTVRIGALILVPLAFATEAPLNLNPSMGAIGSILVTGVFCTAIAMSLYFVVVRRIGVTRSSLVPMFFPVVAVVLGAVVLGERLPLSAFSGLALILAGALAVSSRAPAKPLVSVAPNVPEMQ